MKFIYNNLIPSHGFVAMYFCGLLFIRNEYKQYVDEITINHELIHDAQAKELGYIFFYLIYIIEWLFRLIFINGKNAYENISFEREAYKNQNNLDYLKNRKHYSQWKKKE